MGAAEPPKVWAGHCICNLSSTLLPRQEPVNVTVRLQRWAVAAFDLPLSQGAPVFGAGFFTMLVFSGGPGRARRPRRGRSEVSRAKAGQNDNMVYQGGRGGPEPLLRRLRTFALGTVTYVKPTHLKMGRKRPLCDSHDELLKGLALEFKVCHGKTRRGRVNSARDGLRGPSNRGKQSV